jgi:hypothetical protein
MKNIILTIVTCLAFLLNSCDLTLYPLTEPTSETYWVTVDNLKLYANQFYTGLPQHSDGSTYLGIQGVENNSDNLLNNTNDTRLNGKTTVPSSGGDWNFARIREANFFLENYWKVPSTGVELDIAHYAGEVRFFRAYYYFKLLQKYGDLPWINKTLNPNLEELQALDARLSRSVIADSIIADLDYAIANLYTKANAAELRINRDIALLFKSRVALYEGTWEKYHAGTDFGVAGSNGEKYLALAANAAKTLINEGNYSLAPDYSLIFNQKDLSTNPEVLLWKKYNYLLGIYHDYNRSMTLGGGNSGMTKALVDSYLCTDGKPISVSSLYKGDKSLNLLKQNRDDRLLRTVAFPGYPLQIQRGDTTGIFTKPPLDQAAPEQKSTSGYQVYKGVDPYTDNKPVGMGEIACVEFRFAEALLNYAEATAELGTITQADIDLTINKLRDRARIAQLTLSNITPDPNWDFPELSAVINEVRRERRVELALEGFRLDDLMRWRAHRLIVGQRWKGMLYIGSDIEGTYLNANGTPVFTIGSNLFVDEEGYIDPYQKALPSGFGFNPERDYLLPIPTNEITLSEGTLKQNPNW